MQRRAVGLILVLVGLLFCLVPLTMIEYQSLTGRQRVDAFVDELERADPAKQAEARQAAEAFNQSFDQTGLGTRDPFEAEIDVTDTRFAATKEIFGYVLIPAIGVNLPIYLGASREHLSIGAAQVEGTSLPVGGENTRSVIAGHNGGFSNNYFLFLDRLKPGDRIYLVVQGQLLIYEMYGSEVIDPSDWDKLAAIKGQDTLTLLTCTPPPINSHRLLVDARRVQPSAAQEPGVSPAQQLRAEVRAAEADSQVSAPMQAIQWATRAVIAVLVVALVWVVVLLVRLARGMRKERDRLAAG